MNILSDGDKKLLWLLPYLYLVSITYYWGYWGTFDIDAFNYYAVTDLVKGITSPFRSVFYYIATGIVVYEGSELLSKLFKGKEEEKSIWRLLLTVSLTMSTCLIICVILSLYLILPFTWSHASPNEEVRLNVLTGIAFISAVFLSGAIKKDRWTPRTWLSILIFLLPARAFISGKETALLITENKEFDYVAADSLAIPSKAIYKYLGKSGEYQIFVTEDNFKRIIVSADKLTPLVIENYSKADTASVRRFNNLKKQLVTQATPSPKQPIPIQQTPPQPK